MSATPSMIITTARNNIIGQDFSRPWVFSEELPRLHHIIKGKPVIVGRKTFFAIRPFLEHCHVTVLSRDKTLLKDGAYRDYQGYGYWFVDTLQTAFTFGQEFAKQHGQSEYFIIGGADIFEQSLSHVQRIYRTTLPQNYQGCHKMPNLVPGHWQTSYQEENPDFVFEILNRVPYSQNG